jgi:hypothetical protein
MRRSLSAVLASVIMALGVGTVAGKACHGVNFPEQTQVQASPLTLNGLGLRQATMLKVNVYIAALYMAQKSTDANAILASNTPKPGRKALSTTPRRSCRPSRSALSSSKAGWRT